MQETLDALRQWQMFFLERSLRGRRGGQYALEFLRRWPIALRNFGHRSLPVRRT